MQGKERKKMFRVYVYYLRSSRKADFRDQSKALEYAHRIAGNGKAVHITVEDLSTCKVILDLYPEI